MNSTFPGLALEEKVTLTEVPVTVTFEDGTFAPVLSKTFNKVPERGVLDKVKTAVLPFDEIEVSDSTISVAHTEPDEVLIRIFPVAPDDVGRDDRVETARSTYAVVARLVELSFTFCVTPLDPVGIVGVPVNVGEFKGAFKASALST